jgi:hypothetical protein
MQSVSHSFHDVFVSRYILHGVHRTWTIFVSFVFQHLALDFVKFFFNFKYMLPVIITVRYSK